MAWLRNSSNSSDVAQSSSDVAQGVLLAQGRQVELESALAAGDYAAVVSATRELYSNGLSTTLPAMDPAVAAALGDAWVSTTAPIEVAVCMPPHPFSADAPVHVERYVTLGAGGAAVVPMIAWGSGGGFYSGSADGVLVQGSLLHRRAGNGDTSPLLMHPSHAWYSNSEVVFVADETPVTCDATPVLVFPGDNSTASSTSALPAFQHDCMMGGVRQGFGSKLLAQQAAAGQQRSATSSRIARLGLRNPAAHARRVERHARGGRLLTPSSAAVSAVAHRRSLFVNPALSTGFRSALAFRLRFSDQNDTEAIDTLSASWIMGNATINFARMSYGHMTLNLTLLPFVVPLTMATTTSPSASTIQSTANSVLSASYGISASAHQHVILLMPWCDWLSFGGLGSELGTYVWLNFQNVPYSVGVVNHELGHNFGLNHASLADPWTGAWVEYGDLGDIMGAGIEPTVSDYGSGYKLEIDWMPPSAALVLHPSGPLLPFPPASTADIAAVVAAGGAGNLPGIGDDGATLGAVGGGFIPLGASDRPNATSSSVLLTLRTASAMAAAPDAGDVFLHLSLRARMPTAPLAFTMQEVPMTPSEVGNSLLVDPAPCTVTQDDAGVSVGQAFVYDPDGTRLLLETLNATHGYNSGGAAMLPLLLPPPSASLPSGVAGPAAIPGDVESVLLLRATYLTSYWRRPEGGGCGAVPPASTASPIVCQADAAASLVDVIAALTASGGTTSAAQWAAAAAAAPSSATATSATNPVLLPCNANVTLHLDAINPSAGLVLGLPAGSPSPQTMAISACGTGSSLTSTVLGVYGASGAAFPGAQLVGNAPPTPGGADAYSVGSFNAATGAYGACSSVQVTLWPAPSPGAPSGTTPPLAQYLRTLVVYSPQAASTAGKVVLSTTCAAAVDTSTPSASSLSITFVGGAFFSGTFTASAGGMVDGRIRWDSDARSIIYSSGMSPPGWIITDVTEPNAWDYYYMSQPDTGTDITALTSFSGYALVTERTCTAASVFDGSTGLCVSCPLGSSAELGSGGSNRSLAISGGCVCGPGLYNSGGTSPTAPVSCAPCPAGTYKSLRPGGCLACPPGSNSTGGATRCTSTGGLGSFLLAGAASGGGTGMLLPGSVDALARASGGAAAGLAATGDGGGLLTSANLPAIDTGNGYAASPASARSEALCDLLVIDGWSTQYNGLYPRNFSILEGGQVVWARGAMFIVGSMLSSTTPGGIGLMPQWSGATNPSGSPYYWAMYTSVPTAPIPPPQFWGPAQWSAISAPSTSISACVCPLYGNVTTDGARGSGRTAACICPAGSAPGGSDGTICTPCSVGFYRAAPTNVSGTSTGTVTHGCYACPAGKTTAGVGATACTVSCTGGSCAAAGCGAGYAPAPSPAAGCVDVNECAVGNGGCSDGCSNTLGSYACTCPAGSALRSNGLTCAPCPEGTAWVYSPSNGSAACAACPPNFVSAANGTACACPWGFSAPAAGSCIPPGALTLAGVAGAEGGNVVGTSLAGNYTLSTAFASPMWVRANGTGRSGARPPPLYLWWWPGAGEWSLSPYDLSSLPAYSSYYAAEAAAGSATLGLLTPPPRLAFLPATAHALQLLQRGLAAAPANIDDVSADPTVPSVLRTWKRALPLSSPAGSGGGAPSYWRWLVFRPPPALFSPALVILSNSSATATASASSSSTPSPVVSPSGTGPGTPAPGSNSPTPSGSGTPALGSNSPTLTGSGTPTGTRSSSLTSTASLSPSTTRTSSPSGTPSPSGTANPTQSATTSRSTGTSASVTDMGTATPSRSASIAATASATTSAGEGGTSTTSRAPPSSPSSASTSSAPRSTLSSVSASASPSAAAASGAGGTVSVTGSPSSPSAALSSTSPSSSGSSTGTPGATPLSTSVLPMQWVPATMRVAFPAPWLGDAGTGSAHIQAAAQLCAVISAQLVLHFSSAAEQLPIANDATGAAFNTSTSAQRATAWRSTSLRCHSVVVSAGNTSDTTGGGGGGAGSRLLQGSGSNTGACTPGSSPSAACQPLSVSVTVGVMCALPAAPPEASGGLAAALQAQAQTVHTALSTAMLGDGTPADPDVLSAAADSSAPSASLSSATIALLNASTVSADAAATDTAVVLLPPGVTLQQLSAGGSGGPAPSGGSSGLSSAAVAGISIGAATLVLILVAAVLLTRKFGGRSSGPQGRNPLTAAPKGRNPGPAVDGASRAISNASISNPVMMGAIPPPAMIQQSTLPRRAAMPGLPVYAIAASPPSPSPRESGDGTAPTTNPYFGTTHGSHGGSTHVSTGSNVVASPRVATSTSSSHKHHSHLSTFVTGGASTSREVVAEAGSSRHLSDGSSGHRHGSSSSSRHGSRRSSRRDAGRSHNSVDV